MYADIDYYKNTYKGSTIPDEYLEYYLELASEKIDGLTYNRIVYIKFEKLTPFQQEKVQKACCLCAEYFYDRDIDAVGNGNITSYKVLDINVSIDNKNNASDKIKNTWGVDERTFTILKQSGLMCGVV
jgi:hypothetical protein